MRRLVCAFVVPKLPKTGFFRVEAQIRVHNSSINFLFLDYNTCVVGSQNKRLNVVPQKRSKIDELENIHNPTHKNVYLIHHARIQEFSLGGVQVNLTKKYDNVFFFVFFLFSPQLILQKSNGQFQRKLSFSKFPEGIQRFPGEGGSNRSFTIETHITCGFPGGPDPLPPPPLDPPLTMVHQVSRHWYESSLFLKEPELTVKPLTRLTTGPSVSSFTTCFI